ncbi:hypothetical protein ILYODFUR_038596 [Ilyodon furcidens]|uniref:Uncharacterized protein n=1 Tax=Ilyodon furcidens TaxID=33524 RepID=A0ABV0V1N4_9TELE
MSDVVAETNSKPFANMFQRFSTRLFYYTFGSKLIKKMKYLSIYVRSITANLCRSVGGWCLSPTATGREAEYILDKSPVHHKATQRHTGQTTRHAHSKLRAI